MGDKVNHSKRRTRPDLKFAVRSFSPLYNPLYIDKHVHKITELFSTRKLTGPPRLDYQPARPCTFVNKARVESVSTPVNALKLKREQKKNERRGRGRGKKVSFFCSPPNSTFCSRSSNSSENACYTGYCK